MTVMHKQDELNYLQNLIDTNLSAICHVGDTFHPGFRTIKRDRIPIHKYKSQFDIVTMGPSGHRYHWSYEVTLPHKVGTKNVDSIRKELDKTK
jgi:hypothetical protein